MKKSLFIFSLLTLVISTAPTAAADSDPFPGIATGSEIPGTRVSGDGGVSCPSGAGNGIEVNATTGARFSYCVKTWRPSAEIDADIAYRSAIEAATSAAEVLSREWNSAHPGLQKCFQWGPVVHANGVTTSSGGVCANPVGISSPGSSETQTANSETTTAIYTQDPLPEVPNGSIIPGTKVSSPKGVSQSAWEASSAYKNAPECPTGTGRAIELNLNFTTDSSDDVWSVSCVKNFVPQIILLETTTVVTDTATTVSGLGSDSETALARVGVPDLKKEEAQLVVKKYSNSLAVIKVSTDYENKKMLVVLTKKDSPSITIKITTNEDGNTQIKTKRDVSGFSVTLKLGNVKLDTDKIK